MVADAAGRADGIFESCTHPDDPASGSTFTTERNVDAQYPQEHLTFRSAPRSGNALALGRRLSRPLFREPGEFLGEAICIDVLGIEVVSDPFAEVGVAFMLGIVDGLEELGVAPGATNVFGGDTLGHDLPPASGDPSASMMPLGGQTAKFLPRQSQKKLPDQPIWPVSRVTFRPQPSLIVPLEYRDLLRHKRGTEQDEHAAVHVLLRSLAAGLARRKSGAAAMLPQPFT
jgi:hypothetical protein